MDMVRVFSAFCSGFVAGAVSLDLWTSVDTWLVFRSWEKFQFDTVFGSALAAKRFGRAVRADAVLCGP